MKSIDFYDAKHNRAIERNIFQREKLAIDTIEKFVNNKDGNSSLLDLGCGEGTFLLELLKNSINVDLHGTEFSEHQLAFAKSKVHNAKFKQANLENGIPYENESFDIIYSGEVIEHLNNPDFFVSEVYRVLKKNGLFVFTTPNLCNWISRLLFLFGIYPIFYESSTKDARYGFGVLKKIKRQTVPVGHIRVMNLDAVRSLILDKNFEIIKIQGHTFEHFTGLISIFDRFMTNFNSLASGFVVCSKKRS